MTEVSEIQFKNIDGMKGEIYFNKNDHIVKSIINNIEYSYVYNDQDQIIEVYTGETKVKYTYCGDRVTNERHFQMDTLYYEKWLYYNKDYCNHIVDSYGTDEWYDMDGNVTDDHPYL